MTRSQSLLPSCMMPSDRRSSLILLGLFPSSCISLLVLNLEGAGVVLLRLRTLGVLHHVVFFFETVSTLVLNEDDITRKVF